jgi:hypothetical protein
MKPVPKPTIQAPTTHGGWQNLMTTVISRAVEVRSRFLPGLRDAQATNQAEMYLRRLGIIHQNDIDRLFPR